MGLLCLFLGKDNSLIQDFFSLLFSKLWWILVNHPLFGGHFSCKFDQSWFVPPPPPLSPIISLWVVSLYALSFDDSLTNIVSYSFLFFFPKKIENNRYFIDKMEYIKESHQGNRKLPKKKKKVVCGLVHLWRGILNSFHEVSGRNLHLYLVGAPWDDISQTTWYIQSKVLRSIISIWDDDTFNSPQGNQPCKKPDRLWWLLIKIGVSMETSCCRVGNLTFFFSLVSDLKRNSSWKPFLGKSMLEDIIICPLN